MIHASAPGKLLLTGEWCILEPGNPAVVAAVNKRIHGTMKPAAKTTVTISDFGIEQLELQKDGYVLHIPPPYEKPLRFVKHALETVYAYFDTTKDVELCTWSDVKKNEKLGFGSSAAAVVAIVGAFCTLMGKDVNAPETKKLIYKLSAYAHFKAQQYKGSCADIAASTYGGIMSYKAFDPVWLKDQMNTRTLQEIMHIPWKNLETMPLHQMSGMRLLVGWTGVSVSTREMVDRMNAFKKKDKKEYDAIYSKLAQNVDAFIDAWDKNDQPNILAAITRQETNLRELTKKSQVPIETPPLKTLATIAEMHGGAGKLSGAGGGDCGIAVCFDIKTEKKIAQAWKHAGLKYIDASIDENGVQIE